MNKLIITTAIVSALTLGQAQAMYTGPASSESDYQRYARIVLGNGERSTAASEPVAAPDYETYRRVVGGVRAGGNADAGGERTALSGYAAYQRVVGGQVR
jgi:hypothetical protein